MFDTDYDRTMTTADVRADDVGDYRTMVFIEPSDERPLRSKWRCFRRHQWGDYERVGCGYGKSEWDALQKAWERAGRP